MSEGHPGCDVVVDWGTPPGRDPTFCGKPAVAWYPARGGHRMNLCADHVKGHERYINFYGDPPR